MECAYVRENLGPLIDGELSPADQAAVGAHLAVCADCSAHLARLETLVRQLKAAPHVEVQSPAYVWHEIERRLSSSIEFPRRAHGTHRGHAHRRRLPVMRWLRKPLAAAASLALFLGATTVVVIWSQRSVQTAQAATVDYSVLLDGLSDNVDAAVDRFLKHYSAEPILPHAAAAASPRLDFQVPPELPGGFQRETVYRLRFGSADGVAARYRRDGEPLVVFFHPPVGQTRMGVHQESQCHVAGREGQCVEVGPWRLLHFTDPTTCHCLLSKIQDEATQSAIFAAVAPRFK